MNALLKNWWILTVKGLITFIFGLIAISSPITTLILFVRLLGVILITSGLSLVYISIKEGNRDRTWKISEGFIDLLIGLILLSLNEVTPGLFISLVAIWISVMGILQISNGYRLRGLLNHYWILIFNGIMAIAFASIIFIQPYHQLSTMVVLIGLQASVFGGFLLIISMYIRKIFRDIDNEIPHKAGEEANQELSYY